MAYYNPGQEINIYRFVDMVLNTLAVLTMNMIDILAPNTIACNMIGCLSTEYDWLSNRKGIAVA